MARRQTPSTRRTGTRKPPQSHVVEGEIIEGAKRALEEASNNADHGNGSRSAEPPQDLTPDSSREADPATAELPTEGTVINSDLEAKVTDLKHSLEQSQQKEQALQQKIEQLQSQLDKQNALAQKLQTSLEKANKIQAELDQAQKTALQLAESNQKLIDENKLLKQAQQNQPTESSKKASQLNVQPQPDRPSEAQRSSQEQFHQRQAASLAHPVFPDDPMPNRLSEQDIGWFD